MKDALDSKANISDLATVATSGSYTDLTDTPTIPTKVSDLTNDSGFITNTVNNLTNYYTKTNIYSKSEVDSLISTVGSLNIEVVQTLPTQDISTSTIYLVPKTASTNDNYDEYIYVNNNWEHIGSTEVDLSNYYTKTQVDGLLDDKADITDIPSVGNAKTYYGTCSTGETAQEKIVVCNNFVLETGATIFVKFTNGNKSSYPTKLNVNSTGAKDIARVGATVTTTYYWTFGELVGFTYDGTNWVMLEKGTANTEYYGITKLSSSTSSTSTALAATSSAVKAAYDLANGKQDALVSGTNIKTINNETLLGSGNINISSGGGGTMVDMRVNDSSVVSDDIGNIVTESEYDSSTNKIATMNDIPTVPTKTSDLTNDSGFISTETDPVFTASAAHGISSSDITTWNNKSDFSGDYNDLTNKPTIPTATSDLTNDSGFISTETDPVFNASAASGITSSDITKWDNAIQYSSWDTSHNVYNVTHNSSLASLLTVTNNKINISNIPTPLTISDSSNTIPTTDQVYTALQKKQDKITNSNKLSYTLLEDTPTIPDELSDLTDDSTHRLVTDTEKSTWNGKSDFSGSYNDLTNKPTIPTVPTNVSSFTNDAGYLTAETDPVFMGSPAANILTSDITHWNNKQDELVSGTNIKTINSQSIVGSGNVDFYGTELPIGTEVDYDGSTVPSGWVETENRIGKLLWEGSFSSGSITVPGISDYVVVAMIVGGVTCLGSQLYGGCSFTRYNSLAIDSYGYRFTYSAANDRLTIDNLNRGGTSGTASQPITKIYGVF